MSYTKTIVVGYLGTDPAMRYTPSGQAVTNFSVAVNRQYKNHDGETVKKTTWFRVAAWGRQAENCNNYLHKGSLVLVEGELVADDNGGPRVWAGQDGSPHASFELNAASVRFLSAKNGNELAPNRCAELVEATVEGNGSQEVGAPAGQAETDESIPF